MAAAAAPDLPPRWRQWRGTLLPRRASRHSAPLFSRVGVPAGASRAPEQRTWQGSAPASPGSCSTRVPSSQHRYPSPGSTQQ